MKYFILFLLLFGCTKHTKDIDQDIGPAPANTDDLIALYEDLIEEAGELQGDNGWIGTDCDGMIWNRTNEVPSQR